LTNNINNVRILGQEGNNALKILSIAASVALSIKGSTISYSPWNIYGMISKIFQRE